MRFSEGLYARDIKGNVMYMTPRAEILSSFRLRESPNNLFQRGDKLYVSSDTELACYNSDGEKEWASDECNFGQRTEISGDESGFYIPQSQIRSEVDVDRECRSGDLMGQEVVYANSGQTDLWLGQVDLEGIVGWNKLIGERANSLSRPLVNDSRIVLPFEEGNSKDGRGFYVLDKEGNVLGTEYVPGMRQRPFALVDDSFVYQQDSTDGSRVKVYDIATLAEKSSTPVDPQNMPGSPQCEQVACSATDSKVFFRSKRNIRELDIATGRVQDYSLPNFGMGVIDDKLIVERARHANIEEDPNNKIYPSFLEAYSENGTGKVWGHKFSEMCETNPYGFWIQDDRVLVSEGEFLKILDADGNLIGENNLAGMLSQVAKII